MKLDRRRGFSRARPDLGAVLGWLGVPWVRAGLVGLATFGLGYLIAAIWLFPSPDRSESLDLVAVPNVTELHFEESSERLESVGLEPRMRDRVADRRVPPNWVVAQSPLAGQLAAAGAPVYLTLSRGPEMQTVPDLTGLSPGDAEAVLAGLGFEVERRVVEGRGSGGVRGTRPAAGEQLEVPARVELEIFEGAEAIVVPDLKGRHIDDVAVLLEGEGLQLGTVRYDEAAPEAPGRVVGQFPPPGFSLKVGGLVSVEVAGPAVERRRPPPGEEAGRAASSRSVRETG